jgi:hypothetical protein
MGSMGVDRLKVFEKGVMSLSNIGNTSFAKK